MTVLCQRHTEQICTTEFIGRRDPVGWREEVRLCGRVNLPWGWRMSRSWTAEQRGWGRVFQAEDQHGVWLAELEAQHGTM